MRGGGEGGGGLSRSPRALPLRRIHSLGRSPALALLSLPSALPYAPKHSLPTRPRFRQSRPRNTPASPQNSHEMQRQGYSGIQSYGGQPTVQDRAKRVGGRRADFGKEGFSRLWTCFSSLIASLSSLSSSSPSPAPPHRLRLLAAVSFRLFSFLPSSRLSCLLFRHHGTHHCYSRARCRHQLEDVAQRDGQRSLVRFPPSLRRIETTRLTPLRYVQVQEPRPKEVDLLHQHPLYVTLLSCDFQPVLLLFFAGFVLTNPCRSSQTWVSSSTDTTVRSPVVFKPSTAGTTVRCSPSRSLSSLFLPFLPFRFVILTLSSLTDFLLHLHRSGLPERFADWTAVCDLSRPSCLLR